MIGLSVDKNLHGFILMDHIVQLTLLQLKRLKNKNWLQKKMWDQDDVADTLPLSEILI